MFRRVEALLSFALLIVFQISAPAQQYPFAGIQATLYFNANSGGVSRQYPLPIDSFAGAAPFISSANAGLAAQAQIALQQAAAGTLPAMPQLATAPVTFVRQQYQWIEQMNRQLATPAVQEMARKDAQAPLQAMVSHDPFKLTESLDGYYRRIAALQAIDPQSAARLAQVGKGTFLDNQGVIAGLPDAPRVIDLITPLSSPVGRQVRDGVNHLMTSRQILEGELRLQCQTAGATGCEETRASMEQVRTQYDELMLALRMAEQLGVLRSPTFTDTMSRLQAVADFHYGVAKGIYDGALSLAEGLKVLVTTNPITTVKQVAVGLSNAIVRYPQTFAAIKNVVHDGYDTLLHGTTEERGHLVGRVGFEALTTLLPALKGAGAAVKGMESLRAAEGLSAAEKIGTLASAGKFPLLETVAERSAVTVAVMDHAETLAAAGKISGESAGAVKAMASVFPTAAASALESSEALAELPSAIPKLAAAQASAREVAALGDASVASLITAQPKAAIGFLSEHGPEALSGASRLSTEAGLPNILSEWSGKTLSPELAKLGERVARMATPALAGDAAISLRNFTVASRELASSGRTLSEGAYDFLVRYSVNAPQVAGRAYSAEELTSLTESYLQLEKNMAGIAGKDLGEVELWRGMRNSPNRTVSQIFDFQPKYNLPENHRFTQPGEMALYTTMGEKSEAMRVITKELKLDTSEKVVFDSRKVQVKNMLDLTDVSVRERLGVASKSFLAEEDYHVSHQLGHVAREAGFDGIIVPSAVARDAKAVNVILFR